MHTKGVDQKMIVGASVALIIIAGAAFFGGMKYSEMSRANRLTQGFPGDGQASGRTVRFSGGGAAFGKVLSKDATSITIQLQGGPGANTNTQGTGSKIILINASTQIQKSSTGTSDDLKEGQSVMIQGTQNNDGSITAQNIQIRPAGGALQRPTTPSTQ